MALPTRAVVLINYTTVTIGVDDPNNIVYKLFIDGDEIGTNAGTASAFFTKTLSVGDAHHYEIKSYPKTASSVINNSLGSYAASGFFIVKPFANLVFTGFVNNQEAEDIAQFILDVTSDNRVGGTTNVVNKILQYTGLDYIISLFSDKKAPDTAIHPDGVGGYAPFTVGSGGGSFEENYGTGANVHAEIRKVNEDGSPANVPVEVQDFVAGQMLPPIPTSTTMNLMPPDYTGVGDFIQNIHTDTPEDNQVDFTTQGRDAFIYFVEADLTITTGNTTNFTFAPGEPIYDYCTGLDSGTKVRVLALDTDGNMIGWADCLFTRTTTD